MKYQDNIKAVAKLQPDYLGFIFYKKSPRHFEDNIPELPKGIKKVGVFVDEEVEFIVDHIEKHQLDAIQLHGNESTEICKLLQSTNKEIIKVFAMKHAFNFDVIKPYEDVCDYFLFDTKGKLPGGNGYTFDWKILKSYPSTKPYFLSGGIGLENTEDILSFLGRQESKYCYAIDVNSKFELKPGLKHIEKLEKFKNNLRHFE